MGPILPAFMPSPLSESKRRIMSHHELAVQIMMHIAAEFCAGQVV